MPMHTNYGDHLSVTITRVRKGTPTETVLWSVQQRLYDEIRAEQGLQPHMPVGFGLCRTMSLALPSGLQHAAHVHEVGQRLDAAVKADVASNRSQASDQTMRVMHEYNLVTADDRDDLGPCEAGANFDF